MFHLLSSFLAFAILAVPSRSSNIFEGNLSDRQVPREVPRQEGQSADTLPTNLFITGVLLSCLAFVVSINRGFSQVSEDLSQPFRAVYTVFNDFSNGRFYNPIFRQKWVYIKGAKHTNELAENSCLSQTAVYVDAVLAFKHKRYSKAEDEHRVLKPRLFNRILMLKGPNQLSALHECLSSTLERNFATQVERNSCASKGSQAVARLPVLDSVRTLNNQLMSVLFFGQTLANDEEFTRNLFQYPVDTINWMMAYQFTPSFLTKFVHPIVTRYGKPRDYVQGRLRRIIAGTDTWTEPEETKTSCVLYSMIQVTKDMNNEEFWTPSMVAETIVGLYLAASHNPGVHTTHVLLELCNRQDWQQRLRQEIGDLKSHTHESLDRLPLLDSFMKETLRHNPFDQVSIRRKALKPYTFSNGGPAVPVGTLACISQRDVLHDQAIYKDPLTFDPSRFSSMDESKSKPFSEASDKFPLWGLGSLACPGRLYAIAAMKLVVAQFISSYNVRLEHEGSKTYWEWETFRVTYQSTKVVLNPLE